MSARSPSNQVAVIEVGSRALRLLVANVVNGQVDPILTRSHETRLMGSLAKGSAVLSNALADLDRAILDFEALAMRHGIGRVEIFGTEVVRRLATAGEIRPSSALARARILSANEEAQCSALAARSALRDPTSLRGPFLVIDQGAGSLELVTGDGSEFGACQITSMDLGGQELMERFSQCGSNLGEYREQLGSHIKLDLDCPSPATAFALGSVATKWAWLFSDPPRGSRYSSRRAHGAKIEVSKLNAMIDLFVRLPYADWEGWRATFDPANPASDDMERVITGGVVLAIVLGRLGIEQFIVSAQGTRHGFALMADVIGAS